MLLESSTIFKNQSDNYFRIRSNVLRIKIKTKLILISISLQVSVSFDDTEKRPGQSTILRVESDPQSLCAVGVVDKSVHILGGSNQLTIAKVRLNCKLNKINSEIKVLVVGYPQQ